MKDAGEIVGRPQQVQVLDYLRARSCCPSPFAKGDDTSSNKQTLKLPPWMGRCWCTCRQVISGQYQRWQGTWSKIKVSYYLPNLKQTLTSFVISIHLCCRSSLWLLKQIPECFLVGHKSPLSKILLLKDQSMLKYSSWKINPYIKNTPPERSSHIMSLSNFTSM